MSLLLMILWDIKKAIKNKLEATSCCCSIDWKSSQIYLLSLCLFSILWSLILTMATPPETAPLVLVGLTHVFNSILQYLRFSLCRSFTFMFKESCPMAQFYSNVTGIVNLISFLVCHWYTGRPLILCFNFVSCYFAKTKVLISSGSFLVDL